MAAMTNVPRDILESMRDNLDRRVKLSIKRMVNLETRKDKWENRVLAFSQYRLFVFTAKSPTKLDASIHYLDIESIESKKPNHLIITTSTKTFTFLALEAETEEIDHMVTHIGTSLKTVFPSVSLEKLIKKLEVQPSDRVRVMYDMMKTIGMKEMGPCGGFTHMYACMCDFHNLVYRDEVAWDVDTIYLSQDSRELCLRDFDHLKERDLVPIVSALIHNNWFTSLNANNVKLTQDVCNEILRLVQKNEVMESLRVSGTGIGLDFVKKLATMTMSSAALHELDLSNNMVDDVGAEHIFGALSSRGKMFTMIDLSRTKVTSKGLNKIAESMNRSPHVFSSLLTLKLSQLTSNKVDDMQNMYSFLAAPNMLTHLDLSGTDFELDRIMVPLLRGCSQTIKVLKLSKLVFTHKKTKDVAVLPSFKQFFSSVYSLKHLDLSGSRLPPDALKDLLLGVNSNVNVRDLHINISGVDMVGAGCQYLQNCLVNVTNISSLDISNIVFQDQDLIGVLQSIGQNKSIKQLAMGRVFQSVKPKNLQGVMDELVRVIQEDDAVLESLSLADSKLKDSMNNIINALGSNSSLTEIDISGNLMGDLGARMLSKALQINNKLKTIVWDRNCTGCQGFEDIADALEKNYTLKKMPIPVYDASAALRTNPERTEQALQTIERLLQRNHSPQKYSSDQAYRLQQGFLISSTQQMVDRLVVQSQDTINALSMDSLEPYRADVELAKLLINDADKSKRLLPRLHDIANQSHNSGSPVEMKLKEISVELKSVLEEQMQSTVKSMVESTSRLCKTLMNDEVLLSELETGCKEKGTFPKDFTKNILDGVDTDIFNKLSELNLAVAAHISDRIIDEVIERLSKSHKTLTDHLNQKRKDVKRKGQTKKAEENESNLRTKDAGSPHDSPKIQSKRKSMHARKIRPQSVIDKEQVQVALAQDPANQKPAVLKQHGPSSSGSRSPKKAILTKAKARNKKESKLKPSTSTPDITKKPQLISKKSSSASNSRSTSPVPKIEVTYENVGDVDLLGDLDLDPVYDNAIGVQRHALDMTQIQDFHDVLDSEKDKQPTPVSAPSTPSNELIESFDDVPELSSVTKLSHATKNRAKRPKNVRPTTRQSTIPPSTNDVKVDEDVESFFTKASSTDSSNSTPNKPEESPKHSSNKSTPEARKKSSGGLFGFGNKEGKEKEKEKEPKKTGGLSGLFKNKSKPSPPPSASKTGHRISNVQEEEDEKHSPSLHGSMDRKPSDTSISSSSARESLRSEKSSVKGDATPDTLSTKSGESENAGSNDKEKEFSSGSLKFDKDSDLQKKPLAVPRTKRSFTKADNVKQAGETDLEVVGDLSDAKKDEVEVKSSKAADKSKDPDNGSSVKSNDSEETEDKISPKEPEGTDSKPEPQAPAVPRRPGAPGGLGFGINIMAEMKEKQKRKSMMPVLNESQKPSPDKNADQSPKQEREPLFGLKNLRQSGNKDDKGSSAKSSETDEKVTDNKSPKEEKKEPLFGRKNLRHSGDSKVKQSETDVKAADKRPKQEQKELLFVPKVPSTKQSETNDKVSEQGPKQENKEHLTGLRHLRQSGNLDPKVPSAKESEADDKKSVRTSDGKVSDKETSVKDTSSLSSSVKSDTNDKKSKALEKEPRLSTGSEKADKLEDKGSRKSSDSDTEEKGADKGPNKPPVLGKKPSLNGEKPVVVARQDVARPPLTKPKPPGNKPKPAPRTNPPSIGDTDPTSPDSLKKEEKDAKQEGGIVYDSATLKMSVKDKIAKKFAESGIDANPKKEDKRPKLDMTQKAPQKLGSSWQDVKVSSTEGKKDTTPSIGTKPDVRKGDSLPRESTPEDMDKGVSLSQDDLQACDLDFKSDTSSDMTDSGIVYDSDTLKMSVKDKASSLFGESVQRKTGSLPRDTKSGDMKEEPSAATKRPRSMFAVIDNLKNKVEVDKKADIQEEKSEEVENADDTKDDDKKDTEGEDLSPTDVVMV